MKTFILIVSLFVIVTNVTAQQFIDKAEIEYEVKSNIKKTMGNNTWDEMLKDKLPTFKIGYYNYTFAENRSIFKFDHWDEKVKMPEYMRKDDEDNSWYSDFNTGKTVIQKSIFGSQFQVEDSIPALKWTLTSENRVIAGFNCRKAVTQIFDSVYVFAFYTDEIMISGGPCSINGLPGMIMGVTIPRLFTSWIATKVSLNGITTTKIQPVSSKKYLKRDFLLKTIYERTKDWWSDDQASEEENKENQQQKNRYIWGAVL